MEETNGQLIQLWLRKHYKSIRDKQKTESLFGYIDSDEDLADYLEYTKRDDRTMNEDYKSLLSLPVCQSWRNRTSILVLNGPLGSAKTTALRCAIKSLKMQIVEISNSMRRGGSDLRKIKEITQSCRLQNGHSQNTLQKSFLQQTTAAAAAAAAVAQKAIPTQKGSIGYFLLKSNSAPTPTPTALETTGKNGNAAVSVEILQQQQPAASKSGKQQNQSSRRRRRHRLDSSDSSDEEGQDQEQKSDSIDEIALDTKDQNKKVLFFPNFDVQLDVLFQNEVLKLADDSKVPFILSTSLESETLKHDIGIDAADTIQFSKPSDQSLTILLYMIFEIERVFRRFHNQTGLYVALPELKDKDLTSKSTTDESLTSSSTTAAVGAVSQVSPSSQSPEEHLVNSSEFQTLLSGLPNAMPNKDSMEPIRALVNLFQADWNSLFSFLQMHTNSITSPTLIHHALCYLQNRNLKVSQIPSSYFCPTPSFLQDISFDNGFRFNIENAYQIFLHGMNYSSLSETPIEEQPHSMSRDDTHHDMSIEALGSYLTELEHLQILDVFSKKTQLYRTKQRFNFENGINSFLSAQSSSIQSQSQNQSSLPSTIQSSLSSSSSQNQSQLIAVASLENSANSESGTFFLPRVAFDQQQMASNYSVSQIEAEISSSISSLPSFQSLPIASNFFQNDITDTIDNLQQTIFREQFKQYGFHYNERVDRGSVRKSQIKQHFYIISIMDQVKTTVGPVQVKRTRSQRDNAVPAIPVSLVEKQLSRQTYAAFKHLQHQFKQKNIPSSTDSNSEKNTQTSKYEQQQQQQYAEPLVPISLEIAHKSSCTSNHNPYEMSVEIELKQDNLEDKLENSFEGNTQAMVVQQSQ